MPSLKTLFELYERAVAVDLRGLAAGQRPGKRPSRARADNQRVGRARGQAHDQQPRNLP
jgi:hypothetical protein